MFSHQQCLLSFVMQRVFKIIYSFICDGGGGKKSLLNYDYICKDLQNWNNNKKCDFEYNKTV